MNTLECTPQSPSGHNIAEVILVDREGLLQVVPTLPISLLTIVTSYGHPKDARIEFARKPKPSGDKKKEKAKKRHENGITLPNELNRRRNEGMYEKYRTGIPKKKNRIN